jgi:surfactin synthase thioesterase subunit
MILPPRPPDAELVLLCLPYAGGRGTAFRDWADELPASVRPVPVDYPRGEDDSVGTIAARLALALAGWPATAPLALFGHSLGALVAYELALRLVAAGRRPRLLLVSGHRAPDVPALEPAAHALPSAGLQAWLARWGGVPRGLRHDPVERHGA